MKRRYKILGAFILIIVFAVAVAFYLLGGDPAAKRLAEATRKQLREQGFKTELSDFNFATSVEMQAREAAITNASGTFRLTNPQQQIRRRNMQQMLPKLMEILARDAAEVVASQDIKFDTGEDYWQELRNELDADRQDLDKACEALLAGPVQFHLDASRGQGMLLPHLAALKALETTLGSRVVMNLHNTNREAAWTNLLASARLVTAWEPEPVEISHLVRYACAQIAFNTLWQALQFGGWSEEQLVKLEQEWAGPDFMKGLPETAAFSRASWIAQCQLERSQPLPTNGMSVPQMLRSPRYGFYEMQSRIQMNRYREYGSYEDEAGMLQHYRDRESELRRAIRANSWQEMRNLPGASNAPPFQSKHTSALQIRINSQAISRSFMGNGLSLSAKAAETEARRRVLLTAIALERFKLRKGAYPNALDELATEGIKPARADALVDFIDGKSLRYRTTDDGRFVLYSIGLDCIDHGGVAEIETLQRRQWNPGVRSGTDIVWPRPASDQEVQAEEDRKQAEMDRLKALRSPTRLPAESPGRDR